MGKEEKLIVAVKTRNSVLVNKILQRNVKNKSLLGSTKLRKLNVDYQEPNGMSAMHHASAMGNVEILEALISSGARLDLADARGQTPLHHACAAGHVVAAELLLRRGSVADVYAHDGLTPLHVAAAGGHSDVVRLLLNRGASRRAMTVGGKTPLDLAGLYGRYNVMDLLTPQKASQHQGVERPKHLYAAPGQLLSRPVSSCQPSPNPSQTSNRSSNPLPSPLQQDPRHSHGNNGHYYPCDQMESQSHYANLAVLMQHRDYLDQHQHHPPQHSCHHHLPSHRGCSGGRKSAVYDSEYVPESFGVPAPMHGQNVPAQNTVPTLDPTSELRQNLKDACFAVQAKAIRDFSDPNNPQAISFRDGDLVTVLRENPSGIWKGFVTSEGLSRTGVFPGNAVQLLGKRRSQGRGSRHSSSSHSHSSHSRSYAVKSCSGEGGDSESAGPASPRLPPQMEVKNSMNGSMYMAAAAAALSPCCPGNGDAGCAAAAAPDAESNRNSVASYDSGRGSAYASSSDCGRSMNSNFSSTSSCPVFSTAPLSPTESSTSSGLAASIGSGQCFHCTNGNAAPYGGPSLQSLDGGRAPSSTSDSGMSSPGVEVELLLQWLQSIRMECYWECLVRAGYDLGTLTRATPEDLNASGVTNPRDRKAMKAELSRLSVPDGLPDYVPESLSEWLRLLRLEQYQDALLSQGYTTIEQMMQLAWDDLEEMGIEKLGHQKKLILAIERLRKMWPNASSERTLSQCDSDCSTETYRAANQHKFRGVCTLSRSCDALQPQAVVSTTSCSSLYTQTPSNSHCNSLHRRLRQHNHHSQQGTVISTTRSTPHLLQAPPPPMRTSSVTNSPSPCSSPLEKSGPKVTTSLGVASSSSKGSMLENIAEGGELSSRESTLSRSDSVASSCGGKGGTLPFANENAGTIRSRHVNEESNWQKEMESIEPEKPTETAMEAKPGSRSSVLDKDMDDICEMLEGLSEELEREINDTFH